MQTYLSTTLRVLTVLLLESIAWRLYAAQGWDAEGKYKRAAELRECEGRVVQALAADAPKLYPDHELFMGMHPQGPFLAPNLENDAVYWWLGEAGGYFSLAIKEKLWDRAVIDEGWPALCTRINQSGRRIFITPVNARRSEGGIEVSMEPMHGYRGSRLTGIILSEGILAPVDNCHF